MNSTYRLSRSAPLATPLSISLVCTGVAAAWVCTPPHHLASWQQLATLSALYLCVAAGVHIATVWTIFKITGEEASPNQAASAFPLIWGAWIAVVWLPLLALLTSEHSAWVALVLPVIAFFGTLLLWCSPEPESSSLPSAVTAPKPERLSFAEVAHMPFWHDFTVFFALALAVNAGLALLAVQHSWVAGCLLGSAVAFLTHRLTHTASIHSTFVDRPATAASNSIAVWLLLSVALLPFLVGYSSGVLGLLGMPKAHAAGIAPAHASGRNYVSMILFQPPKPHPPVAPERLSDHAGASEPKVIPFDGAYWYFQQPDNKPAANAHVITGDPVTNRLVRATNNLPILMEAHQPLRQTEFSCCRSLRVNVLNGDTVPGSISLDVLLESGDSRTRVNTALGKKVLVSSTVSPMPLNRAPVHETLTFQIPRNTKSRVFDEITVRMRPEQNRSLAGAKVKIESFALVP